MQLMTIDWDAVLPVPPTGPALYWRHKWPEYNYNPGLPKSRGTMQNLDSEGRGPKAVVIGGKVAYTRADLIEWLKTLPVTRLTKKKTGEGSNDA